MNVYGILNLFMVMQDRQKMADVAAAIQQFDLVCQFF